jgi:signal peptidase II
MIHRVLGRSGVILIAVAVALSDQLSKAWITDVLGGDGRSLQAVPGLLDLRLVHNTGAAFSMLRGSTAVLGLLSLVVVIAVLIWLWRQPRLPIWQGLAVGLLLGGSLGNGIDRWRLGYVVDFLALVPINFPIFNPADVAINLAVICFAVDLWSNRSGNRRG